MRVPSSDGVELTVHDLGGDGPPLLLCHATGFHGRVLAPLAGHLGPRFRLWALDFRGHGTSSRPHDGRYGWSGFADDILAVAEHLGLERPAAFGHSKGGAALLLAELASPGRFGSLYLFEPIAFPPAPVDTDSGGDHPLAKGALRRREVFASREEAFANFAAKPPLDVLHPDALAAYVDHGFEDRPDGTVRLRCRGADEAEVYRMGVRHDAFERLGEIGCPTTVASGAHSDAIGPALAAAQVERLERGSLEVFDDLGHFGPMQEPAAVAAGVVRAVGNATSRWGP